MSSNVIGETWRICDLRTDGQLARVVVNRFRKSGPNAKTGTEWIVPLCFREVVEALS
jgi:hypothetical protein